MHFLIEKRVVLEQMRFSDLAIKHTQSRARENPAAQIANDFVLLCKDILDNSPLKILKIIKSLSIYFV